MRSVLDWTDLPGAGLLRLFRTGETGPAAGRKPRAAEARRAEARLRGLSDAELADLGIGRSQIGYAARHGRG